MIPPRWSRRSVACRLAAMGSALMLASACASRPPLERAAEAIGADRIETLSFDATGASFAYGQGVRPDGPWPRLALSSYRETVEFAGPALHVETVPVSSSPERLGEFMHDDHAWDAVEDHLVPTPDRLIERRVQAWLTPQGFLRAALAAGADVIEEAEPADGRSSEGDPARARVVFEAEGRRFEGFLDGEGLVERIETTLPDPVVGEAPFVVTFGEYGTFGSVRFPGSMTRSRGGHPVLELRVTSVQTTGTALPAAPEAVRKPPAERVDVEQIATGVWLLKGGTHHSVLVELGESSVLVEAPVGAARTTAVLAEAARLVPDRPVAMVVNTHHHVDHAGGLRTAAERGLTILTHGDNVPFYRRVLADVAPAIEGVVDGHVLGDGRRRVELHHLRDNPHAGGMLMGYLPRERLLVEADAFTPAPPLAPAPAHPNPVTVNLLDNMRRLELRVARVVPLHGRVVLREDLERAAGEP